jgi:hypothetical protein
MPSPDILRSHARAKIKTGIIVTGMKSKTDQTLNPKTLNKKRHRRHWDEKKDEEHPMLGGRMDAGAELPGWKDTITISLVRINGIFPLLQWQGTIFFLFADASHSSAGRIAPLEERVLKLVVLYRVPNDDCARLPPLHVVEHSLDDAAAAQKRIKSD